MKTTFQGDLCAWLTERFLINVEILACSTDILYLYSCILVYEQCFVVTVVTV